MTLEKLPACLAALLLTACRTIDAPAQDGDSDGGTEAGSTGDAVDPTDAAGDSTSATTSDPTTSPSTTASMTTDDGSTTDASSGVDPDDTGNVTDATADSGDATGTDESGNADESTGVAPPEPCASTCLSLPGGEWQGPVRLGVGGADEPAPGCSDAWGVEVDTLFSDLIAPAAECGCSCGEAQDVTCSEALTLNRKANNGVACGVASTLDSYVLSPGCNPINETDANTRWDLVVPGPQGGSCDPITAATIEPATFTTRYTMCGESAPAEGVCVGDQACVADSDAPLCVWAEGDVACPGDGFGVKHLVYGADVVDTRACTECTCDDPEGTCVTAGVDLYDFDNACVPEVFNAPVDMPASGCVTSPFAIFDAYYPDSAIPTPQTSCTPGSSDATGDVTVQGAVTMCCNG